jgi:spore maturation protein B
MLRLITDISVMIVPMMFLSILSYGIYKKVNLYDSFVSGAKDGMNTVFTILPTLVGLMVAVGILRASGALDIITSAAIPVTDALGYPQEAVPLTLMRLVSSSAATGLLLDIFKTHGPDSYLGRLVSVMMSCTETILYTMSIYFMSVKITKTRYTLAGALAANFAGVAASVYITQRVF